MYAVTLFLNELVRATIIFIAEDILSAGFADVRRLAPNRRNSLSQQVANMNHTFLIAALLSLLSCSAAFAQCTKDTDCKGGTSLRKRCLCSPRNHFIALEACRAGEGC